MRISFLEAFRERSEQLDEAEGGKVERFVAKARDVLDGLASLEEGRDSPARDISRAVFIAIQCSDHSGF